METKINIIISKSGLNFQVPYNEKFLRLVKIFPSKIECG